MDIANALHEHIEVAQAYQEHANEIAQSGEIICHALQRGRKILFCGNGGSAADAQHLAAELIVRYHAERRALPAIALTTDTSVLTAAANDYGYEQVFARQVAALGQKGDVLVAISTSGHSPNVLKAIEAARTNGLKIIGLTGAKGNEMDTCCDLVLHVPSDVTARVQEMHILTGHIWCEMVDEYAHEC